MWLRRVPGCGLWWCLRCAAWCGVPVRRGVPFFCVGTWWVPRVTSIVVLLWCPVFPCVRLLCRAFRAAAFCRGVRYSVLRWGWIGVGLCLVVLCGAVSCGVVACSVAVRCGALPCGLLRCVVLLLLILVGSDGFSFCGVVLWHVLWLLAYLSGLLMACHFVGTLVARHCCAVWRCVTLCVVVFYRDVVWLLYCVVALHVLCCRVASGCVGLYVGVWRRVLSRGVACCCLAFGCIV